MPRTHAFVRRHRPLITARIEFHPAPEPDPPLITPRIDFSSWKLTNRAPSAPSEAGSDHSRSSRRPRAQTQKRKDSRALIQKPPGEPGRPGSGGFTLDTALKDNGWTEHELDQFLADVREAANDKLDLSSCFRNQNAQCVQEICDEMSGDDRWPTLNNYDNCWPVRSALKLILKYSAEASRRTETKRVASRVRKALDNARDDDA